MNAVIKMWLIMGSLDLAVTMYSYLILVGTWYVYFSIVPTILLAGIIIPIQRWINQINAGIKRQGGKCYNCNLTFIDKDQATLEDDKHVYCRSCDIAIFGERIIRDGVEYRDDSKDVNKK